MAENYYLLNDMERYNPNFIRTEWEHKSVVETVEAFRKAYKTLGKEIDITAWIRVNNADEKFVYAKAQGDQVCFIRDAISSLFDNRKLKYEELREVRKRTITVANTHCSKSVLLPVYHFKFDEYGLEITMRNNFHDWKVSVESSRELNINFMDLFNEEETINPIYCEGMDDIKKTFGRFKDNKMKFTVEIRDDYRLYTFMYLLSNYVKSIVRHPNK